MFPAASLYKPVLCSICITEFCVAHDYIHWIFQKLITEPITGELLCGNVSIVGAINILISLNIYIADRQYKIIIMSKSKWMCIALVIHLRESLILSMLGCSDLKKSWYAVELVSTENINKATIKQADLDCTY